MSGTGNLLKQGCKRVDKVSKKPIHFFHFRSMSMALVVAMVLFNCSQRQNTMVIGLVNPDDFERTNEIIRLDKAMLRLDSSELVGVVSLGNKIPSQQVDMDGDGEWDQLLVSCHFAPHESKSVSFENAGYNGNSEMELFTNVSFSVKSKSMYSGSKITEMVRQRGAIQNISEPFFQLEGPGIENDKVAFRTFFDPRNGKDIFGKTTNQMILNQIGIGASWHQLSAWGMDVLQVGQSLGAGGLAVVENGELFRLGDADVTVYKERYTGSLESSFQTSFTGWDAGSKKIDGFERLTLAKGNYYYRNVIGISDTTVTLAVGLPAFKTDSVSYVQHNKRYASISTYADQAEGSDTKLGLAILFHTEQYISNETVIDGEEVNNTHYVCLKPKFENEIYFFACWELTDSLFSSKSGFTNYLQMQAEKLNNPIALNIN